MLLLLSETRHPLYLLEELVVVAVDLGQSDLLLGVQVDPVLPWLLSRPGLLVIVSCSTLYQSYSLYSPPYRVMILTSEVSFSPDCNGIKADFRKGTWSSKLGGRQACSR